MKNSFLFILAFLFTCNSFAQIQRKIQPIDKDRFSATDSSATNKQFAKPGKKNKQIFKNLGLTKEQLGKLKEIRQANKAKRQAINDNDTLSAIEKEKAAEGHQSNSQ